MKLLLSPDSYKGSLTAKEVAENMEIGIKSILPNAHIIKLPIADGGEGTVEILINANNGMLNRTCVTGPINDSIPVTFGTFNNNKTAVIEVAESSGLTKVPLEKRNPWETTSYGTGEIIKYALNMGCTEIIIGLGGSATNDGGIGMAQALGVKFYDKCGEEIGRGGKELLNINKIDVSGLDSRINECKIIIASDVSNVLCGKQGASAIFGPQKGATPKVVEKLDKGLENLGQQIHKEFKK